MSKKVFFVSLVLLSVVGVIFALNAPIQDVYHFDMRESMAGLYTFNIDLVDHIQRAVAANIDASVSIGSGVVPTAPTSFNRRLGVPWTPNDPVTQLELAVMAVKVLGRELEVLQLYPLSSPTFSDVTPSGLPAAQIAGMWFDRAFGYIEYYNNFLVREFPYLKPIHFDLTNLNGSPLPDNTGATPATWFVTRADILEFVVRLSCAKYPELFGVGFGTHIRDPLKTALRLNNNSTIVDYAESLSAHLASGPHGTTVKNAGFLYAFEFFFLAEASRDSNVTVPQIGVLGPGATTMAVPVVFLPEFRVYWNASANDYASHANLDPARNLVVFSDANQYAERFWTLALFNKIFNADIAKVEEGMLAPNRQLNNVIVYQPVNTFAGQYLFSRKPTISDYITDVRTFNDPANPNVPLAQLLTMSDGSQFIVTDQTTFDPSWNNRGRADGLDIQLTGRGALPVTGVYQIRQDRTLAPVATPANPSELNAAVAAAMPLNPTQTVKAHRVFLPTSEAFVGPAPNLLTTIVESIRNGTPVPAGTVTTEPLPFNQYVDNEYLIVLGQQITAGARTELILAHDRLNHTFDTLKNQYAVLTLGQVADFVNLYFATGFIPERIEDMAAGIENPNISFYYTIVALLNAEEVPADTPFVAVARNTPVGQEIEIQEYLSIEQVYGQLRALEVILDATTSQPVGLNPATGAGVEGPTPVVPSMLTRPSWIALFDSYVRIGFEFPHNTRVIDYSASPRGDQRNPTALLLNAFGFGGPAVRKDVWVTRSINPHFPLLSQHTIDIIARVYTDDIILKAYPK